MKKRFSVMLKRFFDSLLYHTKNCQGATTVVELADTSASIIPYQELSSNYIYTIKFGLFCIHISYLTDVFLHLLHNIVRCRNFEAMRKMTAPSKKRGTDVNFHRN